jgi:hypothetical protein
VYKESTAVLGPLATYTDPHSWDLCEKHAARLVVPRGWDVVRLPPDPAQERADDLEALANVVREARAPRQPAPDRIGPDRTVPDRTGRNDRGAAQPRPAAAAPSPRPATAEPVGQGVEVGRRGHLRVVRSAPTPQPEG